MEELIALAGSNRWVALGVGVTLGLYAIGKLSGDDHERGRYVPDFERREDEIAYHEARLAILRELDAKNVSTNEAYEALRSDLDELKRVVAEVLREQVEMGN